MKYPTQSAEENDWWIHLNLLVKVSIKVLNGILQYSGVDHGKAAPVLLHVLILDVFVPQWRGQKISSNVNHSSFKKAAEAKEKKELSYTLIDTQTRPINKDAQVLWRKKGFTLWMQNTAKHCIYLPGKSIPWPKSSSQRLPKAQNWLRSSQQHFAYGYTSMGG